MKKLISILLVLVMIFSVTALAAEPEHICAGTCDHAHEEASVLRWECSNHNLVPYANVEYAQYSAAQHRYRSVTGDVCTNAGCDYEWLSYGNWYLDGHNFLYGECVECGYVQ